MKVKFSECVEYMIKGPFGSDMKKSLYVPQGENTYKVYIQGNALQKDEKLGDYYVSSEYFHQKLERFQVHPGDYLITCDGTLGKYIKLSDDIEPGVISSSLLLLKLDENKIYDKYFELLWEQSMLRYLASQARNACLVHLPSAKAIGDVEIVLPDMLIQKEIADKAFLIKAIIKKRNDELELLDELIKARFVELFGNTRDNEKGWEMVSLKSVAEVRGRVGWKGYKKDDLRESGPLVLGATHLTESGCIDLTAPVYLSREKYEESPEIMLQKNDLIFTQRGNTIGKVGLVEKDIGEATINPCVLILRPLTINPFFFRTYFVMNETKEDMWSLNAGSAQPMITQKGIGEYMLMLPPMELQNQFATFVEQTDKSKFDCFA